MNLTVSLTAGGITATDSRTITVQEFALPGSQRRNVILFIGDAMGTAYRDAARLVSRAVVDANGKNAFRESFFDDLHEMDKMPVAGMSMTYGTDSIAPDSANTGTAWATGNKSFLNSVNTFADGNDCMWRFTGLTNASTIAAITDNPRVENLWQYLKRRHGYRTGIVSTAAVTDATPAVQGAYVGFRQARLAMLGGAPTRSPRAADPIGATSSANSAALVTSTSPPPPTSTWPLLTISSACSFPGWTSNSANYPAIGKGLLRTFPSRPFSRLQPDQKLSFNAN